MTVTVRLFAAAREAAGTDQLAIEAGPVRTHLLALGLGPRFEQVLSVSTLISDGYRLQGNDEVGAGAVVDVLPPFAGG
jgi:molybdopterin converting factor small subunit